MQLLGNFEYRDLNLKDLEVSNNLTFIQVIESNFHNVRFGNTEINESYWNNCNFLEIDFNNVFLRSSLITESKIKNLSILKSDFRDTQFISV